MTCRNCNPRDCMADELKARLSETQRDAARYRWLVTCNDSAVWSFLSGMDDDQIDEEIDRWMKEPNQ